MKKIRRCLHFVFNGFADWETSIAIAGLSRFSDFAVEFFSVAGKPVRSMGNATVVPDRSLADVKAHQIDLLLLPGGNAWEQGRNKRVAGLVREMIEQEKVVAAISGATILLGQAGHLNSVCHTSNHIDYLKHRAPDYLGEDCYVNRPCIRDSNLITARGTAGADFALEIFRHYRLIPQNKNLDAWFRRFRPAEQSNANLHRILTRIR